MEEISLVQAYKIVQLHLSESGGLMDQIESGSNVDAKQVQVLDRAIEIISREWRKQVVVPKHIVQVFCNIFPRLEKCIQVYPHRALELNTLYYQFGKWIDTLFAEEPLSEEAAITIVHQQITGLQPLALELRLGHGLNEASLDLFFAALDRLAIVWKSKDQVSKLAAGSLINAQDVFHSLKSLYSVEEQKKLQEIEEDLLARTTSCLR